MPLGFRRCRRPGLPLAGSGRAQRPRPSHLWQPLAPPATGGLGSRPWADDACSMARPPFRQRGTALRVRIPAAASRKLKKPTFGRLVQFPGAGNGIPRSDRFAAGSAGSADPCARLGNGPATVRWTVAPFGFESRQRREQEKASARLAGFYLERATGFPDPSASRPDRRARRRPLLAPQRATGALCPSGSNPGSGANKKRPARGWPDSTWSGQRDSNPRMMAWEAIALPLGDARMCGEILAQALGAKTRWSEPVR